MHKGNKTTSKPRLLVIDDLEENRYTLRHYLRTADFQVQEAATGLEGLKLVRTKPDMVILDLQLPDMSGQDVCRAIRDDPETASIPILQISAVFTNPQDKVKGLEQGADAYMCTPFGREELLAEVHALFRIRRAEAEAIAAKEQLKTILRGITEAYFSLDEDWNFIEANPAAADHLFEALEPELTGKNIWEEFPASVTSGLRMELQKTMEGQPVHFEGPAPGSPDRFFEYHAYPDGARLHVYARDITDRKRAEEALKQSEARSLAQALEMQTLQNAIRIPVWIAHDPNCEYVSGNYAGYDLLGLPVGSNVSAKSLARLKEPPVRFRIHGKFAKPEELPMERAASTGLPQINQEVELVFTSERNRPSRFMLGSAVPLFDSERKVRGCVGAFIEITEMKRVQSELQDAQALLSADADKLEEIVTERTGSLQQALQELEVICHTVAHDLRSPLRAQIGLAQALLEEFGPQLGNIGAVYLERIVAGARRQQELVNDLLGYARLTQQALPSETFDLRDAVEEMLYSFGPEIAAKEVTVLRPSGACLVHAPRQAVDLILENLFANALKFSRPKVPVKIRIGWRTRGAWVRVFVRDNGIGIAKEHQERIFGVFERLHVGEHYPGTGIGLAIVRKAIQRAGGKVGLHSKEGKGSLFWFDLPTPVPNAGIQGATAVRCASKA